MREKYLSKKRNLFRSRWVKSITKVFCYSKRFGEEEGKYQRNTKVYALHFALHILWMHFVRDSRGSSWKKTKDEDSSLPADIHFERLLETSKEVQMLHTHSSMTCSARSFLRQKGHGAHREVFFFSCGKHVGISYARRCMQHVLPIGCPSVVDNSLLVDSTRRGKPTGAPYTAPYIFTISWCNK